MFLKLGSFKLINASQIIEATLTPAAPNVEAKLVLLLSHNGRSETLSGEDAETAWETLSGRGGSRNSRRQAAAEGEAA